MKLILTIIITFAVSSLNAAEKSNDSPIQGFNPMYCAESEFLTCVNLEQSSCEDAFRKSIEKCDSEYAALMKLIENETSPFEFNDETEKAKRALGKCTVEGLYAVVKEDLLVSCINSSAQRLIDKLEKKYN